MSADGLQLGRRVTVALAVSLATVLGTYPSPATANIPIYNVGDTGPGGGVVFITPSTPGNTTGQYFEVRISGKSMGLSDGGFRPCQFPTNSVWTAGNVVGSDDIGDGAANTTAIRQSCLEQDSRNSAANSAFFWVGVQSIGDVTGWFIPSQKEVEAFQAAVVNDNVKAVNDAIESTSYLVSRVNVDQPPPGTARVRIGFKAGGFGSTSIGGADGNFIITRMFTPTAQPGPQTAPNEGTPIIVPPSEFRLGFNANGGACNSTNSGPIIDGVWIQVPTAEQCSRPGFRLLGWNPKPDGSDPLGFDPGGWTLMTDDNTLFAIWVPSG